MCQTPNLSFISHSCLASFLGSFQLPLFINTNIRHLHPAAKVSEYLILGSIDDRGEFIDIVL
jgi:hypothetical protein